MDFSAILSQIQNTIQKTIHWRHGHFKTVKETLCGEDKIDRETDTKEAKKYLHNHGNGEGHHEEHDEEQSSQEEEGAG